MFIVVLCGFPTEFTEAIWWTATGAGDIGAATNTYTETTVTLTIGGVDAGQYFEIISTFSGSKQH